MKTLLLMCLLLPVIINGQEILYQETKEDRRSEVLVDFIRSNLKRNGWVNMLYVGTLPDSFYAGIKELPLTNAILKNEEDEHSIDDVVPYASNVVILSCQNFQEFEDHLKLALASPYWHPHAHLILYYHTKDRDDLAKIFVVLWFHKACNAIVVQYDDDEEELLITHYDPFVTKDNRYPNESGCWKATKVGRPIANFKDGFVCVKGCHNVTLYSKLRRLHYGTCIGYETYKSNYNDTKKIKGLNLFVDKGKNLHGFVMRAYVNEILPFMEMTENEDGTFTPNARDGIIWTEAAKLMNFKIDISPSLATMKQRFDFEIILKQIYTFARREADIIMYPVYQFDIIVVEVDLSIAYKDSGVCIMSHRAGYETLLFDVKLLQDNTDMVIRFLLCFSCIWFLFFVFNIVEKGTPSLDQLGKDFVNTIRNILSISLYNPPRVPSFRVYLAVSIWCFFVINFSTQAAIVSFFSAYKRGKEVDTFEDVIEKGYKVEGMASPDMMLPDDEERFRIINSRLVPINNLFDCADQMANDSHRFCLIDCSVGRYLERNRLNENGEQYLHIAKDRIHSHYLNMLFQKHSPLTNTFNKYLRMFFEAGLIKKWEEYRFSEVKPEVMAKALRMEDLIGVFKCYYILLAVSSCAFIIELLIGLTKLLRKICKKKLVEWKRTRIVKKKIQLERKAGKNKLVNANA